MPTITTINFNIEFDKINLCGWKDKEESFENLCKEFLIKKYGIIDNVNLIDGYPAIESPVVSSNEGLYYGFQSKLLFGNTSLNRALKDSFGTKKMAQKMKTDDYSKIDVLVIFSNKEKTDDSENNLISIISKQNLKIDFWCGLNFISELQNEEFLSITIKYFDNIGARKAFHKQNKAIGIPPTMEDIRSYQTIKYHEDAFDGQFITQNEKDLAGEYQEEFLLNKRLYCDTPSLEVFGEIEQKIMITKFKGIERSLKGRASTDVEGVYEKFESDLFSQSGEISEIDKIDILAYVPEKDHRKGLLVNLGAEGYCKIEAKEEKTVCFISKINNSGTQKQ